MDAFLEAAASTHPRPPGDTRHDLHALLASHSWKYHHAVTLHPLDHNPQRWTPEEDATTTLTIQHDPESPASYHLTWSNPASQPPKTRPPTTTSSPLSAGLQEAKTPQQPDKEMLQAPLPPATQERPHQEPLAHPITRMELTPQHWTATGIETCHGSGRSTTARSGGTKSHRDSKPCASSGSPNPPTSGGYQQTATTSPSPFEVIPPSHQKRETP